MAITHRTEMIQRLRAQERAAIEPLDATPPEWLNDAAVAEWDRVVNELGDRLEAGDTAALAAYCEAFTEYRNFRELVAADGPIVKHANGYLQRNPAVELTNKARRQMLDAYGRLACMKGKRGRPSNLEAA